ncbi:MAG: YegP family protein [Sphingobacteriaceae bacterium]|nr:YegP family protein [Sphingobacteriaceae bacterium]
MKSKFEIITGKNEQFYFHLKAENGEIILASEAYTSKQSCQNGIESVRHNASIRSQFKELVSKAGEPYFNLVALNGEVIGVSEMYSSVQSRDKGIEAVMHCAPLAEVP